MSSILKISNQIEALSDRVELLFNYSKNMVSRRVLTSIRLILEKQDEELQLQINELKTRIESLEDKL